MTIKDKETIQRALGIIEGAICISPKTVRAIIATAVEMIDEVLSKEADHGQVERCQERGGTRPREAWDEGG